MKVIRRDILIKALTNRDGYADKDDSLEIECIEGMTCDKLCTLNSGELRVLRRLLNEHKD